jgi:hypothetical protein
MYSLDLTVDEFNALCNADIITQISSCGFAQAYSAKYKDNELDIEIRLGEMWDYVDFIIAETENKKHFESFKEKIKVIQIK